MALMASGENSCGFCDYRSGIGARAENSVLYAWILYTVGNS